MQPVEQRDNHPLGEIADDFTAQGNHLFIGVSIGLQALIVIGAEVELEGKVYALRTGRDIGPHEGAAVHEVRARLGQEVNLELPVAEVTGSTHDGAEELLLEGEPLNIVVEAFLSPTAVANVGRFVVVREIVVEAGILGLVLIALLHARDNGVEVYVHTAHVPGNQMTHAHQGQGLVHRVGILDQGVLLFDIASVRKRQTHDHRAVRRGLRDILEGKFTRVYGCRGIYHITQLGFFSLQQVQRFLGIRKVIFHLHRVRLGAAGGEDHLQFVVFQGNKLSLRAGGGIQGRIGIDRGHGGLRCSCGFICGCGGFRMFCPPDAVLLFGYLTALVPEEPYHDKENQDKADD